MVALDGWRFTPETSLRVSLMSMLCLSAYLVLFARDAHTRTVALSATRARLRQSEAALQSQLQAIQSLQDQLTEHADRDPLTGLYNRRYLTTALQRETDACAREGATLALLLIDLDLFKQINDRHGHAAGDDVLCQISALLLQSMRPSDICCRYGGEEFLLVLPGMGLQTAVERAQALRQQVAERYRAWAALRRAREAAEEGASSTERERELLGWQVAELRELAFDADEWQALNLEQTRLAHAAGLIDGAAEALDSLADGEYAVVPQVERLLARVAGMAQHDAQLADVQELLAGASIQLDEALHAMRRYRDRLDVDPARLAEIDQRIQVVMAMARKYRVSPEALPEVLAESVGRLERLTRQTDPEALAREEAQARDAFMAQARPLSAARKAVAAELSAAVTEAMQSLAMGGARFDIALRAVDEGCASGLESVEFLVTANASQPLRPLARVASGGELSRIGLAIQVITAQTSRIPTLVFDEVDVGIGGPTAEVVGQLLRRLGERGQVLTVTHLPQVAAQGHQHLFVHKARGQDSTQTAVACLTPEGRVEEIARMLGGVDLTEESLAHARKMVTKAQA